MNKILLIFPIFFLSCGIVGLDYKETLRERYRIITNSKITYTNIIGAWNNWKVSIRCQYEADIYTINFSYSDCKKLGLTNWMHMLERNSYKHLMERTNEIQMYQ